MTAKSYTEEEVCEIAARQGLVGYPHLALKREDLSVKAKSEPKFRFYNLKRLVVETETLKCAWAQVRANKGAPGVDRIAAEIKSGKTAVYDADLSSYFERYPTTSRSSPCARASRTGACCRSYGSG